LVILQLAGQIAVILVVTFLVARVVSGRLRTLLEAAQMGSSAALLLSRALWVGVWATGVLFVLYKDRAGFTPLSAFIGVVGLAASLSLQTVLQNLVAGIYLLAERPFAIGDTINVVGPSGLNHEGTVQDIQMRTTHLRSRDDEVILVPNAAIFSGVITNRTAVGGYIRQVAVTFPRQTDPVDVRGRLVPLLEDLPSVLSRPIPQLRMQTVGKEDWTACLHFWACAPDSDSEVTWAIARAFPDVTVNQLETA